MNYATIKSFDIANGPGVRVSLFVSGCRHHCKNCFNKDLWDFNYGVPYDNSIEDKILKSLESDYIQGLSLLGGEPFEPEHQVELLALCKRVKEEFPNKPIWCYTGFLFEDIVEGRVGDKSIANSLLSQIDVLVDGKFVDELKDLSLLFRGSSNQRIIDVNKSIKAKSVIWLEGIWKRTMGSGDINEI